jgi:hypothetical protein
MSNSIDFYDSLSYEEKVFFLISEFPGIPFGEITTLMIIEKLQS